MEKLSDILRERSVAALIGDAQFVRDFPDGGERVAEAQRLLRDALRLVALGRISHDEQRSVFAILSFAVPRDPQVDLQLRVAAELSESGNRIRQSDD